MDRLWNINSIVFRQYLKSQIIDDKENLTTNIDVDKKIFKYYGFDR
jgi:hypothetical protein